MATKNEALLIATRNAHKTGEFQQIFGERYQVSDLSAYPDLPEVEETGTTFDDNSRLKAVEISQQVPEVLIMADDSGLEVDALNNAPGVYSARYSGPAATDASNRAFLLENLNKTEARGKQRAGRFRCVLTLAKGGKMLHQTSGAVEGIITNEEKGDGGFGYDPLFVPEGECQTFAQLPASTKHAMSHRGRAVAQMVRFMQEHQLL